MYLGYCAMFLVPLGPNLGDRIQPKFVVGECPAPFFLRTIRYLIVLTLWIDTPPHLQLQVHHFLKPRHRVVIVIRMPHQLPTI